MKDIKFSYDWETTPLHIIKEGVDDKTNKRLLELFFSDYEKAFGEKVNAGCPSCINDYVKKLKKSISKDSEKLKDSGYKLKAKYNGLPIVLGGAEVLNNSNINDKDAEKLFKRLKEINPSLNESDIFEEFPETVKKTRTRKSATPVEEIEVNEPVILESEKEDIKVSNDVIDLETEQ